MERVNEQSYSNDGTSENKSVIISKTNTSHERSIRLDSEYSNSQKELNFTRTRWLALWLISFSGCGGYYWYDLIFAAREQVEEDIMKGSESDSKFNLLYTTSFYISVILSVFSGYVLDKIGLNKSFLLFSFIIVAGQAIICLSGKQVLNLYKFMKDL